jgi:hypothetical protein
MSRGLILIGVVADFCLDHVVGVVCSWLLSAS